MPRAPQARRKMYVLDTNVLIHDPNALLNFEEHDVIIPMTVLRRTRQPQIRQASRGR